MPCEALLQDLGAEHGMALVLLELALGVLDVVAAALHLRPALAQAVLLILQALLDDLGAVREALAEVLRALLGHELGLQGVELQDARVLVHEVHEVGREDVHARGRLVGLLLLGALLEGVDARALARHVVDGGLEDVLAPCGRAEAELPAPACRARGPDAVLLLPPLVQLHVRLLVRLREALAAARLHLQQPLGLRVRRLRQAPGVAPEGAVLVDVSDGPVRELPRLAVEVHAELALREEVTDLVEVLVRRHGWVPRKLLRHLADGHLAHGLH
mmetsp:Transcript_84665/g.274266  ORF Transcript_84665/g.274266 Transcript_84665/m.274266 type:complete len:273 (-) Transcript_84665:1655-2473(-)